MVEIFDNCDRVTVLRDGQYIATMNVAETTPGDVVSAMVGRVIDSLYPPKLREDERSGEIILDVRRPDRAPAVPRGLVPAPQGRDPRPRRPDRRGAQRDRQGHLQAGGHSDGECVAARPACCIWRTMPTASRKASSTCPRTARATACSSTCRSPPMFRRSASSRSPPAPALSTTAGRPSRPSASAAA